MKKIKIRGWWIFLLVLILLIAWIRRSDAKEENDNVTYNELMKTLAKPMPLDKAYGLWKEAYNVAGDNNERRWCLGNVILCKEQKGDFSDAMILLNDFEEEFEVSTPTTIHKAILFSKMGQYQKAKSILDSIVSDRAVFHEPSLWEDIEDALLLGNNNAHVNEAYMNLFNEYVCKIVALSYRAGMETDSLKRLQCLQRFENIGVIDSYVRDYASFIKANKKSASYFLNEKIRTLQKTQLYLFLNYWEPDNTVNDILRFKWTFIQMYLDEYDRCNGINKTKYYFKKILEEKGLASEVCQKYLINAYMSIGEQNNKYNLSYEEFKKLRRGTFGWIVKLTPTTTLNKPSAFINAGVTKPCVLISCNDWNICDSILFNREMVLKDKGKVKKVVILKDDYTTDTLRIKDDLLGVVINYRPINFMIVDLLRQRFFGYGVKKKCNWKIRCFLVQNLWNKEQYNNFNT